MVCSSGFFTFKNKCMKICLPHAWRCIGNDLKACCIHPVSVGRAWVPVLVLELFKFLFSPRFPVFGAGRVLWKINPPKLFPGAFNLTLPSSFGSLACTQMNNLHGNLRTSCIRYPIGHALK